MIYCIWKQEYDDAGTAFVDGPEDADMKDLMEQFRLDLDHNLSKYCAPHWSDPYDVQSFSDSTLAGFVDWLVDCRGFNKVLVKYTRW